MVRCLFHGKEGGASDNPKPFFWSNDICNLMLAAEILWRRGRERSTPCIMYCDPYFTNITMLSFNIKIAAADLLLNANLLTLQENTQVSPKGTPALACHY